MAAVWLRIERGDANQETIAAPEEHSAPAEPADAGPPTILVDRSLTPLWQTVDVDAFDGLPAYDDRWSEAGRVLVDVSGAVDAAPTWRVGDRLAIPLPQLGERHEPTIDRIDEGLGHSRSVRGTVLGTDGKRRRFVVTVGPTRVFAYVDTPHGSYELVADTRLGWLLPSSSMMANLDPSVPDYVLPKRRDEVDAQR